MHICSVSFNVCQTYFSPPPCPANKCSKGLTSLKFQPLHIFLAIYCNPKLMNNSKPYKNEQHGIFSTYAPLGAIYNFPDSTYPNWLFIR